MRIDSWMKVNGLWAEYKKAYLRESNFARPVDDMEQDMYGQIAWWEERGETLPNQLLGSFVFACTPQGQVFWRDVLHRMVMLDK